MAAKFQQRHYEAIAEVLQEALTYAINRSTDTHSALGTESQTGVHMVRNLLTDLFEEDNNLFDIDRFERACQPGANVKARTR